MAGRVVTFLALATVLVLAPAANAAVVDTDAPTGAVGGVRSQAAGVLTLTVFAVDDGLGLSRAAAAIDGIPLDDAAVRRRHVCRGARRGGRHRLPAGQHGDLGRAHDGLRRRAARADRDGRATRR